MKDYYKILGVTPNSSEEEIRKSYRNLAMQYHPDRNPDDPVSEEKFKNVAEAYGVLTDPGKRREYDSCRNMGGDYSNSKSGGGFSYSQEDILRDLFNDPRFQQMFSGLLREFQRSGFRHSSQFVKKSFFGGKGNMFLGGIFLFGSMAGPLLKGEARKRLPGTSSIVKSLGNAVGSLLGKGKNSTRVRQSEPAKPHPKELDTVYHTPLTTKELRRGKEVEILVYTKEGEQTLRVTIPPGSKNGQKLRLRGKGRPGPLGNGDLYLNLVEKNPPSRR
ncbi:MAG: DnaJ domain-containing protein [Desulforhopalus sp.]